MKTIMFAQMLLVFMLTSGMVFGQAKGTKKKPKEPKATTVTVNKTDNPTTTAKPSDPAKPADPSKPSTQKPQGSVKAVPLTLEEVTKNSKPVIQQAPAGNVNWTEQFIEAKGSSVIDNERFKIPAQAKAMATRGAIVIAQRNLLEMINGVNVTSETTVQDMITKSDYIYTRIDGLIKGARQVGEAIEKDGMMEVTMRVPLYGRDGLSATVYDELPQVKGKSGQVAVTDPATASAGNNTILEGSEGLVFNIKGKQIDPSMFPVVVDEEGNLLLDMTKLYDPNTGKFPKVLQSTEQLFNDLGYQQGVDVIDAIQGDKGKIVLDSKNSKKVDWGKVGSVVGSIAKFILMLF